MLTKFKNFDLGAASSPSLGLLDSGKGFGKIKERLRVFSRQKDVENRDPSGDISTKQLMNLPWVPFLSSNSWKMEKS
jgi:hypothetical protein